MTGKNRDSTVRIRGFYRGQIIDHATGRIVSDTGWKRNTLMTNGKNAIAGAAIGATGSYQVGYAAIGQSGTAAHNVTCTDLYKRENSFMSVSVSTAATGTGRCTCSFAGANNSATLTVNEAGLFKTNSAGSMVCAGTFTGSQMTTAQDFNLTYDLQFS